MGREFVRQLLCLQKAIATAEGQNMANLDTAELLLNAIQQDGGCLTVKDLAVNGNDLLASGFAPGPELGRKLQWLLEQVQDERLPNEKQALLQACKEETL
jgi:tRNA nucleotidyltransferase (CCA-adding enzyme)